MSLAKDVAPATLGFLLGQTGQLARKDVLLACVAATAADGSSKHVQAILLYSLQAGVTEIELREVLLEVSVLAGVARGDVALSALARALDESRQPSDPFAAMMAPEKTSDEPKAPLPEAEDDPRKPLDPARARALMDEVHGERSSRVRERISRRSKALARWLEEDLYGRVLDRSGLALSQRLLVAIGALFPLDARALLEDFVRAAVAKGTNAASLWALQDILSRLFREAPELRTALQAFEIAAGKKPRGEDDLGPGAQPFRWD